MRDIKLLPELDEKAFGRQVIELLRSCPRWMPGRPAGGTPTDVDYTLPVRFSKIREWHGFPAGAFRLGWA